MNILFLHPNYPGQFKLLAHELSNREGWRVFGLGQGERSEAEIGAIHYSHYRLPTGQSRTYFPAARHLDDQARIGASVADLLVSMRDRGFKPDVVLAHPGWGDALFVTDVFPKSRFIAYLEFFYKTRDCDLDFDPEFPPPEFDLRFVPLRNAANLTAFATAESCITPTRWQASLFPPPIRSQLHVLHEGIDTSQVAPHPGATFQVPAGKLLRESDEVITYVSRSLEPYRGFHVFMRALPELLRERPKAQVVLVGREDVSYGRNHFSGRSWKAVMLDEVGQDLDWSRVHFVGSLAYEDYLNLLRVSSVHVYLTYPFVLSWSFLEAMACGCTMVGSATGPVLEVLKDGENGRTVGFFDRAALIGTICELLDDPAQRKRLSQQARETVVEHYDFKTRTYPQYCALLGA